MATVLLEEVGPNGNIQAVVEADEDVCFFYLFGAQETNLGMRSVWVRNHSQAPDSLDAARMKSGVPPKNPKAQLPTPSRASPAGQRKTSRRLASRGKRHCAL